jgi:polyketide synthase 12
LIAEEVAGRGGMVVLPLPPAKAEVLAAAHGLFVAAVNGPESVVVSGPVEGVESLVAAESRARRVEVDYASHSPAVEAIRDDLLAALAEVRPGTGEVPFYSSLTGGRLDTTGLDAGYWYANLRERVDFHGAVSALAATGFRVFVEASAHPVLTTAVEETADVAAFGTLRRDAGSLGRVHLALATARAHGIAVDWDAVLPGARPVDLPTYAFQRARFWPRPGAGGSDVTAVGLSDPGHPLLGAGVELPADDGHLFTTRLSVATHPWLADHAVHGTVLLPGTALLELVVRAGDEVGSRSCCPHRCRSGSTDRTPSEGGPCGSSPGPTAGGSGTPSAPCPPPDPTRSGPRSTGRPPEPSPST